MALERKGKFKTTRVGMLRDAVLFALDRTSPDLEALIEVAEESRSLSCYLENFAAASSAT